MLKKGIVYLLMILNVNTYANVVLEPSLRANENHIGINESILTTMKQIWTQISVKNNKRCNSPDFEFFEFCGNKFS